MAKTYAGTYLYGKYHEYEQKILSFIMEGTEIDKNVDEFEDIKYDVKRRQVSNSLVKILESKMVILIIGKDPLPKSFKVFCAKDIKGPKTDKMKVYIDCTNIIKKNNETGRYECNGNNIDILISYLVSAMHTFIYYADEMRICNNSKIMTIGARSFAKLFTRVVDYVSKVNTMPATKAKCLYLASLYYLSNILGKDYNSESCRKIAMDVSGLSSRDAGIIDIQIKKESMMNIKFFVETVADILHISKLTLDVIVERWMVIYGTGTVFALETFPAFASMISDAYVGAYLNNQKAIENVLDRNMVEFTKVLLSIGAESV